MAKRALVIGINDYSAWQHASNFQFPTLRYAVADATSFAGLLTASFGFLPDDITFCQDSEATLQSILGSLNVLFATSQPGDVLCIYFAGLGMRVPQGGWAAPGARYYDAILPSDGAGMIFDFHLGQLAQSMLLPGVNLTIVLDTSHCASQQAGDAVVGYRSVQWPPDLNDAFVAKCRTIVPLIGLSDPSSVDGNVSNLAKSGNGATMNVNSALDFSPQAKATIIAACNYNEVAGESSNNSHGYLTNAFLELITLPNTTMSHSDIIGTLKQKVNGYSNGAQTPQWRGAAVTPQSIFLDGSIV